MHPKVVQLYLQNNKNNKIKFREK